MTSSKNKINHALGGVALDAVSQLTPISLKEAKHVMGSDRGDVSDETILQAILDFTAIARAHFRNIPKYQLLAYNNR